MDGVDEDSGGQLTTEDMIAECHTSAGANAAESSVALPTTVASATHSSRPRPTPPRPAAVLPGDPSAPHTVHPDANTTVPAAVLPGDPSAPCTVHPDANTTAPTDVLLGNPFAPSTVHHNANTTALASVLPVSPVAPSTVDGAATTPTASVSVFSGLLDTLGSVPPVLTAVKPVVFNLPLGDPFSPLQATIIKTPTHSISEHFNSNDEDEDPIIEPWDTIVNTPSSPSSVHTAHAEPASSTPDDEPDFNRWSALDCLYFKWLVTSTENWGNWRACMRMVFDLTQGFSFSVRPLRCMHNDRKANYFHSTIRILTTSSQLHTTSPRAQSG